MYEMSMEEFYELMEVEERQLEKWRKKEPCCCNCKHYGYDSSTDTDLCGFYGDCVCIDEDKNIYEAKCENWK